MIAGLDGVISAASDALGKCRLIADLSKPQQTSLVLELETEIGQRVIAKAHQRVAKFDAELHAYDRWVPSLGGHAPSLVAVDAPTCLLVMTKLDARMVDETAADLVDVHRRAGMLLARFHHSQAATPIEQYAAGQHERLETWLRRAEVGVLQRNEVDFVTRQLDFLDEVPTPLGVPCHLDWQPGNWLIDRDGAISGIDFELARIGPWHEDLHRLWWNEWMDQPGLATAFFEGYGRRLDDIEARAVLATSVLGHLGAIVWASENGDDHVYSHARRCLAVAERLNDA